MQKFKVWALARLKAIYALVGSAVIGYIITVLQDPTTTTQVEGFLPATMRWVAPAVLSIATSIIVERTSNRPAADADESPAGE